MRFPRKFLASVDDFGAREITGQIVLHFHKGVLTRYVPSPVEIVSPLDDFADAQRRLAVEHEENISLG